MMDCSTCFQDQAKNRILRNFRCTFHTHMFNKLGHCGRVHVLGPMTLLESTRTIVAKVVQSKVGKVKTLLRSLKKPFQRLIDVLQCIRGLRNHDFICPCLVGIPVLDLTCSQLRIATDLTGAQRLWLQGLSAAGRVFWDVFDYAEHFGFS